MRGKGIVIINSAVGFGKLYGVILGWLVLDNVHEGNWKLMMAFSALPCIFNTICIYLYVLESPRFLIATE